MKASQDRVFYYHADANPLGGYLTHPLEAVVPAHGSTALSPGGGYDFARAEDINLQGLITSKVAHSQVSGAVDKANHNWTTLVTATVEGLNVLQVVTADRIVSRVAIEYPRDGYYPKISFVGSQFENLRIDGRSITAKLDLGLLTTKPAADRNEDIAFNDEQDPCKNTPAPIRFPDTPWTEVPSFVKKAANQAEQIRLSNAPDWLKARLGWVESAEDRKKKGFILCSLVDEVKGAAPCTTFGHVVHVPDFGNVFLGELIVDPSSFQLTMLRIEMGCIGSGTVTAATSRGNGRGMP